MLVIVSNAMDEDLVHLREYSKQNDNYNYILTAMILFQNTHLQQR
jgi:hypothetical protein